MKKQDYHKTITVKVTPEEAFKSITNIAGWWTKHVQGNAAYIDDTFKTTFGNNWFTYKVIDSLPGKRLVWLVTDCSMPWLHNKQEWKDTIIEWDLTPNKNETHISLTHKGLVHDVECYDTCSIGWNNYIGESLPALIATGKGILFDDEN